MRYTITSHHPTTPPISSCPNNNRIMFTPTIYMYLCKLVTIHPFLQEIGCRQAIFPLSKPLCDLDNQHFPPTQWCSFESLDKIHPFIQEIEGWQELCLCLRRHRRLCNNLSCPPPPPPPHTHTHTPPTLGSLPSCPENLANSVQNDFYFFLWHIYIAQLLEQ